MNTRYYDYKLLNSHNALFNFVITERGFGKSYGAKKMVIEDFLNGKGQFVYVRRTAIDLEDAVPKFARDIAKDPDFSDYALGFKTGKRMSEFTVNGETAGFGVALSTSSSLKSVPFPDVTKIIFDEFIIDKSTMRYLPNEVDTFLELYETIARDRTNVKAYFLGNAISSTNPYFSYDWGNGIHLNLPFGGSEFKKFKDGLIVVNYAKATAFREMKKQTPFGRLVSGTNYGDYAIDNKWLRDSKSFVQRKDGTAKYWATFVLNGDKYGIWRNGGWRVWLSRDIDPSCPTVFALNAADHKEDTTFVPSMRTNPWFRPVLESYRKGLLGFENQTIKNQVMPYILKAVTY